MSGQTFFNRAFSGMLANKVLEPVYTGGAYSSVGNQFTKPTSKFGNLLNDVLNFAVGAFADPYSPAGLAYGVKNVIGNRAYNKQLQDQTQLALLNARQQAGVARATGIQGLPDDSYISPTFDFGSVYQYAMPQQAKNNSVANIPKFVQSGQQFQQSQYATQPQQYRNRQRQGVYVPAQKPGDIPLIQLSLPEPSGQNNNITNNGMIAGGVDYTQPQLFDPTVVDKAMNMGVDTVKNAYDYGEKIYSTDENNKNRILTTDMTNKSNQKITGMKTYSNEKIAGMNNASREKVAKGHDNTALSMNSTNNITKMELVKERKNNLSQLSALLKVLETRYENAYDDNQRQEILDDIDNVQNMINQELLYLQSGNYTGETDYNSSDKSNNQSQGKYIY